MSFASTPSFWLHWCLMRRGLLLLAVLALAGCDSGVRSASRPAATTKSSCRTAATVRAETRLRADVSAIRRAAGLKTRDTLKGNPAINAATDRFLLDVARARVSLLTKNRMIDRAAAALLGECAQCFQALEAERPIPAIAHAGSCG
jgi:hypothetical protein